MVGTLNNIESTKPLKSKFYFTTKIYELETKYRENSPSMIWKLENWECIENFQPMKKWESFKFVRCKEINKTGYEFKINGASFMIDRHMWNWIW